MATVDKDFKVKNGLVVTNGGTFGGTVAVATPTENNHANPSNGNLWYDTVTERLHVYYVSQWFAMATLEDAETLQDHIHDTSIGGTGTIVTTFVSGGFYNDPGELVDAGYYNTTTWEETWVGGIAIDNFN